jgi:acyl-coenzyme A thioesterase PaaI-like protein
MDDHGGSRADLADAARAVNQAVRVTAVDDAAQARATALLREAHELLATSVHDGPHCQVGFDLDRPFDAAAPHQFFPYSPVIGPLNPVAPPVRLEIRPDKSVRGTMVLGEQYCGPPWNITHGGVVALVFDELLGVAGIAGAGGGFTGRLIVHYRKPTPVLEPVELHAWIERIEGRKLIVHGEMRHDDQITAEAEGLFIQVGGPLREDVRAPATAATPAATHGGDRDPRR